MLWRSRDFVVWLVLTVYVTMYAQIGTLTGDRTLEQRFTPPFAYSPHRTDPTQMGAEIYNVGWSLYSEGTFADRFGDATGPTAWVAPLLPGLIAAGLVVFSGSKLAVTVIFFTMQCIVLAIIASIVTGLGGRWEMTWAGILAVVVVGVIHFQYTFQITHDGVFGAGTLDLLMWGAVAKQLVRANADDQKFAGRLGMHRRHRGAGQPNPRPGLGVAVGVATLAPPALVAGPRRRFGSLTLGDSQRGGV